MVIQTQSSLEKNWKKLIPVTFLLMTTITFKFLLLPNRLNSLFIAILIIGMLGSFLNPLKSFLNYSSVLIVLYLLMYYVFSYRDIRFSSFIYTIAIICSVLFYKSSLQESNFQYDDFLATLRLIVYLFGIVVVIQYFCFLLSLPIFNIIPHSEFFVIEEDLSRFPSLSYEPAHYSKIIALCIFAYTIVYKKFHNDSTIEMFRKNALFYFAGILQMVFMKSSTSVILFVALLYLFFTKSDFFILVSVSIVIAIALMIGFHDNIFIERAYQTFMSLFSFDIFNIISADSSAAVRIAPYFIFFQNIDLWDSSFWFGHGFDANVDYFREEVNWYHRYIPDGIGIGGLFVTIPFNYGVFFFVLFFLWIKKTCLNKATPYYFLFFFLICYDMGFNTYIVCFALLVFISIDYFSSTVQISQQQQPQQQPQQQSPQQLQQPQQQNS